MEDWLATLPASVQEPSIAEKLLKRHRAAGKKFKVHLDGYNFLPHLTDKEEKGPVRVSFTSMTTFSLHDCGTTAGKWCCASSAMRVNLSGATLNFSLRAPKLFDLRMDPFEKADHDSNTYEDWWVRRAYLIVPAQPLVANFLKTFKEFPPSQKPAAFNLDQVMEQLYQTGSH